jgi:hypothetical protein
VEPNPDDTLTNIERLEDEFPEGQVLTPTRVRRAFLRTWQSGRATERRLRLMEEAVRHIMDKEFPTYAKESALTTLRELVKEERKKRIVIRNWLYGTLGAIALKLLEMSIERLMK